MKEIKAKLIFQGQYIQLLMRGKWEFIRRHNCSGIVIIIAVTDDQKILFVEQHRPPLNKSTIELPAGLAGDESKHKGENLVKAAKRELLEETGYSAKRVVPLMSGPVSGGSSADIVSLMRAFGLQKKNKGGGDGTEFIKVHEVPLAKVDAWLRRMEQKGFLIEPKIYAGLYFVNKYNENS